MKIVKIWPVVYYPLLFSFPTTANFSRTTHAKLFLYVFFRHCKYTTIFYHCIIIFSYIFLVAFKVGNESLDNEMKTHQTFFFIWNCPLIVHRDRHCYSHFSISFCEFRSFSICQNCQFVLHHPCYFQIQKWIWWGLEIKSYETFPLHLEMSFWRTERSTFLQTVISVFPFANFNHFPFIKTVLSKL